MSNYNKRLNKEKLLSYGFAPKGDCFSYTTGLFDNQLTLTVTICVNGEMKTRVVDNEFDEEYTLHMVESAFGSYVGKVREEYNSVIKDIEEKCYEYAYPQHSRVKELYDSIYEKFGDTPEHPFGEDTPVWKSKENKKWYCIKMRVKPKALGLSGDDEIDVINVKIEPHTLDRIADNQKYFRAYHMNKKMWTTIILDGRLSIEEIMMRVTDSYNLVKEKANVKNRR